MTSHNPFADGDKDYKFYKALKLIKGMFVLLHFPLPPYGEGDDIEHIGETYLTSKSIFALTMKKMTTCMIWILLNDLTLMVWFVAYEKWCRAKSVRLKAYLP